MTRSWPRRSLIASCHCHLVTIRGNSYRMRQHTELWQTLHAAQEPWSGLQKPEISFYAVWEGEELRGFGALKELARPMRISGAEWLR